MTDTTRFILTEDHIATFHREGVLLAKGAFTNWVETLRQGIDDNLASPGEFSTDSTQPGESGRFVDDYCNWHRIDGFREFAENSNCAELAGRVMGAVQARLFHEHIVIKEPGTGKATPWHHDMPYYCVDGPKTVSVWIALDYVPLEATVRFVAGSQDWGRLYYPRRFKDGTSYSQDNQTQDHVPDIDAGGDKYLVREWACEPGDAVLFDFKTLHGTTAAILKHRRRAIAFRWLGEDAIYLDRHGETSPPYPELKARLKSGDALPEDIFPTLWRDS